MTKRETVLTVLSFILFLIVLDLVDMIHAYQVRLIRSDNAKVIDGKCSEVSNEK